MLAILLGALLILGGVLSMVGQSLWRGRLSGRRSRPAAPDAATLEPPERGGGFGRATYWPGFAMIALGVVLLLARAAALI